MLNACKVKSYPEFASGPNIVGCTFSALARGTSSTNYDTFADSCYYIRPYSNTQCDLTWDSASFSTWD